MAQQTITPEPMISGGFLTKLTLVMGLMAATTAAISVAGKWYGRSMSSGQYSDSTATRDIVIGLDRLALPENTIRFPEQRADGPAEQVNLIVQWPQMTGYERQDAARFLDTSGNAPLVFMEISQATMTRDMSGRVAPIYTRLFAGRTEAGPAGLALHRFKENSGYGEEVLLTDPASGVAPYAVRCMLPASPAQATNADCQRDVHLGQDLNVEYRFSSNLLAHWKELDSAVKSYVEAHLAR